MAIAVTNDASVFKRSANVPAASSFSLWGWFNFTSVTPARFWGPLGIYAGTDGVPGSGGTQYVQVSSASSGSSQLVLGGGTITSINLAVASANTWYFIALTASAFTTGNIKAHIRAITANTLTTVVTTGNATSFTADRAEWGREAFTGDFISGSMHAIGLADVAKSVDELLEISYYHEPQLDGISSLNCLYPCIESVNTNAVVDRSGNARNATATVGALADSPPLLWRAIPPPWNLPAITSSDVTLGLTGQALAAALGALIPANALTLAGQSLAGALGTAVPATTKALIGSAVASALGTLVPTLTLAITGQVITIGQGNVSAGGDLTIALTGQLLSSAQGTVVPGLTVPLAGSALVSAQGAMTPATAKALSGSAIVSSLGTLAPTLTLAITGQVITIGQGNVTAPGNVTVALTGVLIASSQGTVIASSTKALTGSALASSLGAIGPAMTVVMTGSVITASLGVLTNPTAIAPGIDTTRLLVVSVRIDTALRVQAPDTTMLAGWPNKNTIH